MPPFRDSRIVPARNMALSRFAWPICAVALAGCSGWSAGPSSPFQDLSTTLSEFEANYTADRLGECLAEPLTPQRPSPHSICRDRIAQSLMAAIDVRYAIFEQGLLDTQRYTGLAATVVQLGLSAAASVASGGTTQALAAASTAVGGVNEAVNRDVLVNRTATALMSSMQARRNEIALRVRTGLGRSALEYPLGVALSDLFAYYRAGTLAGATTALSEAASTQAMVARQGVDESLGITPAVRIVSTGGSTVPMVAAPTPPPPRQVGIGFSRTTSSARLAACVLNSARPLAERRVAMEAIRQALRQQPQGARWIGSEASFIRNTEAGAEEMRAAVLADAAVARQCPVSVPVPQ